MGWGRLGVIIESNLNRVRLSCCWVGVGLGCDNIKIIHSLSEYYPYNGFTMYHDFVSDVTHLKLMINMNLCDEQL